VLLVAQATVKDDEQLADIWRHICLLFLTSFASMDEQSGARAGYSIRGFVLPVAKRSGTAACPMLTTPLESLLLAHADEPHRVSLLLFAQLYEVVLGPRGTMPSPPRVGALDALRRESSNLEAFASNRTPFVAVFAVNTVIFIALLVQLFVLGTQVGVAYMEQLSSSSSYHDAWSVATISSVVAPVTVLLVYTLINAATNFEYPFGLDDTDYPVLTWSRRFIRDAAITCSLQLKTLEDVQLKMLEDVQLKTLEDVPQGQI